MHMTIDDSLSLHNSSRVVGLNAVFEEDQNCSVYGIYPAQNDDSLYLNQEVPQPERNISPIYKSPMDTSC